MGSQSTGTAGRPAAGLGVASTICALAVSLLFVFPPHSADAAIGDVVGTWTLDRITESAGDKPVPESIVVTISGRSEKAKINIALGGAKPIDLTLSESDTKGILVREDDKMRLFSFSAPSKREEFLSGEVIYWAREVDEGVILYEAQIDPEGMLSLVRLSLMRSGDTITYSSVTRHHGDVRDSLNAVLRSK